ncbi:MAG: permease, partial [Alphaproteobacteria bacterium]
MTDIVLRRAGAMWHQLRGLDRVWLLVMAIPLVMLLADPAGAPGALDITIGAFGGTMPYMAIAIRLIALLKATGSEGIIGAAFQGRESRMIVMAALIGGLAPFCSCEVIPFVAALLAAGTPLSAVMAFWLSSPLMDPPTFAITAGTLGVEFAIGKTAAAVAIGLAGGFATRALVRTGVFADALRPQASPTCGCGPNPMDGRPVWRFWTEAPRREIFGRTAFDQALFLGKW